MVWKNHVSITTGRRFISIMLRFIVIFECDIFAKATDVDIITSPTRFFTHKNVQKFMIPSISRTLETWNTLLLYTFAQHLAPSNFLKVVGYVMNLQIAYYHFQSAISHIWHQQEPYSSELRHCWSCIAYVLHGLITKRSVHLLKMVSGSKIQICSSGLCTWPALLGRNHG
jgi:hypothetical protein